MDDQNWRKEMADSTEVDAFSKRARKFYCWGRGTIKEIKQGFNRRLRRQAKQGLKNELFDTDDCPL